MGLTVGVALGGRGVAVALGGRGVAVACWRTGVAVGASLLCWGVAVASTGTAVASVVGVAAGGTVVGDGVSGPQPTSVATSTLRKTTHRPYPHLFMPKTPCQTMGAPATARAGLRGGQRQTALPIWAFL